MGRMKMNDSWQPTSKHKKIRSHTSQLGKLWTLLNSLETALRLMLCQIEGTPNLMGRVNDIFNSEVGKVVDDDPFTMQLQLHELIRIFNEHVAKSGAQLVDPEIGEMRHALAHGRVTSVSEYHDIRLINFKRKKGGALFICYSATLTPAWFTHQRKHIEAAIKLVYSYSQILAGSPQREIIYLGNVEEKDVANLVISENISDRNPSHRFLIVVGQNISQDDYDDLSERFRSIAKIVRL